MTGPAKLLLGIPSKGRLMDAILEVFALAGLKFVKSGAQRNYRGQIEGLDNVEIAYLSAPEIASGLKAGTIHLGVTGEDLLREQIADFDARIKIVKRFGFGRADVVVAVPDAWLDVWSMADLDEVALRFHEIHGRRLKVATKYLNLTRRFFADKGVSGYRIVESLGATEGAPAAGTAEVIVDITSTGSTLKANHLRVLADGVILNSEAVLAHATTAAWTGKLTDIAARISAALG